MEIHRARPAKVRWWDKGDAWADKVKIWGVLRGMYVYWEYGCGLVSDGMKACTHEQEYLVVVSSYGEDCWDALSKWLLLCENIDLMKALWWCTRCCVLWWLWLLIMMMAHWKTSHLGEYPVLQWMAWIRPCQCRKDVKRIKNLQHLYAIL